MDSQSTNIYHLIGTYHRDGVTFDDFMREHKEKLGTRKSTLADIKALISAGKVSSREPWEGRGYLKRVELYAKSDTVRLRVSVPAG